MDLELQDLPAEAEWWGWSWVRTLVLLLGGRLDAAWGVPCIILHEYCKLLQIKKHNIYVYMAYMCEMVCQMSMAASVIGFSVQSSRHYPWPCSISRG